MRQEKKRLKDLTDDYFEELEHVARYRLHPENLSGFFMITLFASLLFGGIPLYIYLAYDINYPIFEWAMQAFIASTLITAVLLVVFWKPEVAMKYQKIQVLFLPFVAIKIGLDPFTFYLLMCADRDLHYSFSLLGLFVIAVGLLLLAYATWRAFRRVRAGHLREGGRGIYDFANSRAEMSFTGFAGFALMGGAIPKILEGQVYGENIEALVFLTIVCFIYIPIVIALPEFILLAYCKCKYKRFIVKERFGE